MEYTLRVYTKPSEIFLLNWRDEFYQEGDRDITKAEFEALANDPRAVIVTMKANRPRQRIIEAGEIG